MISSVVFGIHPSYNQEPIFKGSHIGQSQWKKITYKDGERTRLAFVNTSQLNAEGNGEIPMYTNHGTWQHLQVAVIVTAVTPLYVVSVWVYNLLRIIAVNAYLIGHTVYQLATRKEDQKISSILGEGLKNMMIQTANSILNILRAPFYGIAYIFALLYSIIDPLNGRQLAGEIELAWNHGIPLNESIWSIELCPCVVVAKGCKIGMKDYQFEGGGLLENLGRHGFYLAGCMQPSGYVRYENDQPVKIYSRRGNPKDNFTNLTKKEFCCPSFPLPKGCKIADNK